MLKNEGIACPGAALVIIPPSANLEIVLALIERNGRGVIFRNLQKDIRNTDGRAAPFELPQERTRKPCAAAFGKDTNGQDVTTSAAELTQ